MCDENYCLSCVQGESCPRNVQNGHGSLRYFHKRITEAFVVSQTFLFSLEEDGFFFNLLFSLGEGIRISRHTTVLKIYTVLNLVRGCKPKVCQCADVQKNVYLSNSLRGCIPKPTKNTNFLLP